MIDDDEPMLDEDAYADMLPEHQRRRLAPWGSFIQKAHLVQQRRKERKERQGTIENEDLLP
jgi:hypothetical protein